MMSSILKKSSLCLRIFTEVIYEENRKKSIEGRIAGMNGVADIGEQNGTVASTKNEMVIFHLKQLEVVRYL